jgi:hypothetical protein
MSFFVRAIFLFLILANVAAPSCFAQREGAHVLIRAINGAVKEVDAQKSSFVLQTDEGDMEFVVPRSAKMFRGTESVAFKDIEKEDEATVKYYEDEAGQKQVLSITLEG